MSRLSQAELDERREAIDSAFGSGYHLEAKTPSPEMLAVGELFATGCIDVEDLDLVIDALVEHSKRANAKP